MFVYIHTHTLSGSCFLTSAHALTFAYAHIRRSRISNSKQCTTIWTSVVAALKSGETQQAHALVAEVCIPNICAHMYVYTHLSQRYAFQASVRICMCMCMLFVHICVCIYIYTHIRTHTHTHTHTYIHTYTHAYIHTDVNSAFFSQVFGADGVPSMLKFPDSESLSKNSDPSLTFSSQLLTLLTCSQTHAKTVTITSRPEVACGAIMAHLDLLSARIKLPVVVPPHVQSTPPSHCVGGDDTLVELCNLLSTFLTKCSSEGSKNKQSASTQGISNPISTPPDCDMPALARSAIVIGALRLIRVNLDWLQRAEEGGCGQTQVHAHSERLEPVLRGLVTDEGLSQVLPATARAHVRTLALEAYAAGIRLFFGKPSGMLHALRPLVARVRANEALDMERQICGRYVHMPICDGSLCICMYIYIYTHTHMDVCMHVFMYITYNLTRIYMSSAVHITYHVFTPPSFANKAHVPVRKHTCTYTYSPMCAWNTPYIHIHTYTPTHTQTHARMHIGRLLWEFGQHAVLHDCLKEALELAPGDQKNSDSSHAQSQPDHLTHVLADIIHCMFDEFSSIAQRGEIAVFDQGKCATLEEVKVPLSWLWGRCNASAVQLTNEFLTARKVLSSPDYSVVVGAQGFASGVHCWELHMDVCQRMVIGVCKNSIDLDRHVSGGAWCWASHGTASGPEQEDREVGEYTNNDLIRMELDSGRGTLALYKNGILKGTLHKVTGEVFPFVCMDNEGEQVTLGRRWSFTEKENGADTQYMSLVCSRAVLNALTLLTGLAEKQDSSAAIREMCTSVLDTIMEKLCDLFKILDQQGQKDDTPSMSVLSLFDWVARTAADHVQRHALEWLPCMLSCASRVNALQHQRRLLPRMVETAKYGTQLTRTCSYLRRYQGAAMRSYALKGWSFPHTGKSEVAYISVDHGVIEGDWTLEFVVMRARMPEGCTKSVLAGTRDFCVKIEARGVGGHVEFEQLGDGSGDGGTNTNNANAGQKGRVWSFGAACPLNTWVLLTFVCQGGATSMFVDGCRVGMVAKTFALSLRSIGVCPELTKTDGLCGSVRECRVYNSARTQEDMLRYALMYVCVCMYICIFFAGHFFAKVSPIYIHVCIHSFTQDTRARGKSYIHTYVRIYIHAGHSNKEYKKANMDLSRI
jgi:hypothetical protein